MIKRGINPSALKLAVNMDDSDQTFPNGFLEGYASVFNNVDLGGDIVRPGAFRKTLKERLKTGDIKLIDSHNVFEGTAAVIGVVTDANEDDHGLRFKARFSSVQRAQDIRTKIKEGILNAISFGYDIVKAKPVENNLELQELKLYEVSPVIWGMNPEAQATAVKSAIAFQDFTVEGDVTRPWVTVDASKRLQSWVSSQDSSSWSPDDWKKYSKGFLWHDTANAEALDAYKFPVVDVIDGSPKYIFRGVVATLAGIRSGDGAWSTDKASMESSVKKIYEKFGQAFPESGAPIDPTLTLVEMAAKTEQQIRLNLLMSKMRAAAGV